MTTVIQPNSMTELATSSSILLTQPIIRPALSISTEIVANHKPVQNQLDEKSVSLTGKIPASSSGQITNYYIKKMVEKQQPLLLDQSYKERLLECATEEEKEIIESIDTVKTRYKLLTSLEFNNRPLLWKALCQSYPQDEHVAFYNTNSTSTEINPNIQLDQSITQHRDSILRIASLYSTRHTYYEGMDHLIHLFVSIMPENEAYSVFVRLLEIHDIPISIYQQIEDRLHDAEIMLKHLCPDLVFEDVRPTIVSWLRGTCISAELMDIIMLDGYTETMLRYIAACLQESSTLDTAQIPASSALSIRLPKRHSNKPTNTVPALQQQIEDLLRAMSQLQKEHDTISQENMQLKIKEMDDEQMQTKLIKRNAVLEKRLKKYKTKLATATSTATMTTETPSSVPEAQQKKQQQQYQDFVDSLRETGDFGALIAGALAPQPDDGHHHQNQHQQTQDNNVDKDVALQNVTSELVAVKLAQFETQQKCEQLESTIEQLEERLKQQQHLHEQALQKAIYLQNELEDMQMERDQLIAEQEEVVELAMVAKKTSTELQMEKLQLAKQVQQLECTVKRLEEEKQNYFMPRDSFSEEVFAAHSILFGQQSPKSVQASEDSDEYKAKYVESELRCRELEKYLAETKVKLAELESNYSMATPRTSFQPSSRRASMIQYKRSSTASLSMLANRVSTPTTERRESTDSFASSTTSITSMNSSQYSNKRSSALYSRIWNAFGTPTTKPLLDEPQIIEQA